MQKTTMGERVAELTAEIDSLGRPNKLRAVLARKPNATKTWDDQNPELARRYWLLFAEREELYAKIDSEYKKLEKSKMTAEQVGIQGMSLKAAEKPLETPALIAARGVLSDPEKPILVLSGRPGCGKTVAASVVCMEFVKNGGLAQFIRATEFGRLGVFGEDGARVELLRDIGLMVVDDLGTEQATPSWTHNFNDVLDYRYQDGLKTILTTNLTPEQFVSRYGERAMRRIFQSGRYFVVPGK